MMNVIYSILKVLVLHTYNLIRRVYILIEHSYLKKYKLIILANLVLIYVL